MKLTRRKPIWIDSQRPLTQWYASALGQSILDKLEVQLEGCLGDVFGYQGLQIGNVAPDRDLFKSSGLQRKIILDAPSVDAPSVDAVSMDAASGDADATNVDRSGVDRSSDDAAESSSSDIPASGTPADIHGDVLQLPIASDTMKLVMFVNTLDFCAEPHQALREADRVLGEDGQLLIIGFNPISAFGARHALSGWRGHAPWNGRFYSRRRVKDWLSVLDYRVLMSEALFIRPPINSERLLRRTRHLEKMQPWIGGLGGVYLLLARKQTLPLTPGRRQWRRQRNSVPVSSFARARETAAMRKAKQNH